MTHFVAWWDAVGFRQWGDVITWPEHLDPTPANLMDFVRSHEYLGRGTAAHLIHIETGHVRATYKKGRGARPGKHPWVCPNATRYEREVL